MLVTLTRHNEWYGVDVGILILIVVLLREMRRFKEASRSLKRTTYFVVILVGLFAIADLISRL